MAENGNSPPFVLPSTSSTLPPVVNNATPPIVTPSAVQQQTPPVEAVGHCRLPTFWRTNPELWFIQVEAVFQVHQVRGDNARFYQVIAVLDPDTISEIADVLRTPPAVGGRYDALKAAILHRMTESADRQLHKLLTGLELGDKKPSQLLRQMRSLAGDRATDDVIRIKWLDLLPPPARRLLKVFKAPSLEELAEAADEICDGGPSVMSASFRHTPATSENPPAHDPVMRELADLRQLVTQLLSASEDAQHRAPGTSSRRARSTTRTPAQRSRSATPANPQAGICWYHARYGLAARHCRPPCTSAAAVAAAMTPEN